MADLELKIELVPIAELSSDDLHVLGYLAENELLLTRRMTREEFEERYGPAHQPAGER